MFATQIIYNISKSNLHSKTNAAVVACDELSLESILGLASSCSLNAFDSEYIAINVVNDLKNMI